MQEKYGFDFKKEKDKDPETHQKSLQIWEKDQNKRYQKLGSSDLWDQKDHHKSSKSLAKNTKTKEQILEVVRQWFMGSKEINIYKEVKQYKGLMRPCEGYDLKVKWALSLLLTIS